MSIAIVNAPPRVGTEKRMDNGRRLFMGITAVKVAPPIKCISEDVLPLIGE